ncbi:MAG TPA: hypothetical protein VN704_02305 [Verrucomicrobiae bacterium]|nr:hypothetical protein [Verrucomicrobiae bacterium]
MDMRNERISLFAGSITTQIHTNSNPAFIVVSSRIYYDFRFTKKFLWSVLLNPFPDGNIDYFD